MVLMLIIVELHISEASCLNSSDPTLINLN